MARVSNGHGRAPEEIHELVIVDDKLGVRGGGGRDRSVDPTRDSFQVTLKQTMNRA
jgi:hypothetical protein